MKYLITLFLCLSACGKSQDQASTNNPEPVDPNAALTPSVSTCEKVLSKLDGDYFIDLKPQLLFISGGRPYFVNNGNFVLAPDGGITVGTICALEVNNGRLVNVKYFAL